MEIDDVVVEKEGIGELIGLVLTAVEAFCRNLSEGNHFNQMREVFMTMLKNLQKIEAEVIFPKEEICRMMEQLGDHGNTLYI